MSVILSYSDNTTGTGWIAKDPYSGDDIKQISDPNGDTVEQPRTAIPSPFAQVDLVLTAFESLAGTDLHSGALMHHRLVSNALDIAQILFDFPNHASRIRLLRWNPGSALEAMRGHSDAHNLLADTLELYMRSDDDAYNFSAAGEWYIIMSEGRVLGSTSPATLTMAAPGLTTVDGIMVEQGRPLFGEPTHLWERDEEFVLYLVQWFNAFPEVRRRLSGVYSYILTNLEIARKHRPGLFARVLESVENPSAFNLDAARSLEAVVMSRYAEPATLLPPRIFGVPMLCRKPDSILDSPKDSDFLIRPQLEQNPGELLPLILREGFTPSGAKTFRYLNHSWNPSTRVRTEGVPVHERTLPDSSVKYPWLTSCDLLEDTIVELATPLSPQFFSAMERGDTSVGCLLPIKPVFFKYFPATMLMENVAVGRKAFELRHEGENIVAILRIPTAGGYVELQRTYLRRPEISCVSEEEGNIISGARISMAVFPFVRTGVADIYNIRLFEMNPDYQVSLDFFRSAAGGHADTREPQLRTRTKTMTTRYYELDQGWDYARVALRATGAAASLHAGIVLPIWPEYTPGADEFSFAVDFGTTNSHVEYCIGDSPARPLEFEPGSEATLVATLEAPGSLAQADTLLDVEFIPRELGTAYGFPLRTALARNASTDARAEVLRSVNIPFLYERKPFNGYRVSTMLKWGDEQDEAEQFLRELMLLIRARVLLHGGSPARVKLLYFYPVSMKRSLQHRYLTLWEDLYARYIDPTHIDVRALPESVAPAFFYHNASTEGSDYASIDIGGGSSDIVIYKADADRLHSNPEIITSFRFAGNALFGDAFSHADAASNPMVKHYAAYFSKLLEENPSLSYLNVILADIMETGRSEDINAFLFSIEQAPGLRSLRELDRRPYSYNSLLGADPALKIIFLYFYAALIYYVASLMLTSGISLPRRICFSGTGSKILNILGRHELVKEFTQAIIEKVYGKSYAGNATFEVNIEKEAPKQVTCKGGLELQRRMHRSEIDASLFSPRNIQARKTQFTLTDTEEYTYGSIRTLQARQELAVAVEHFNEFFVTLLEQEWGDEFGVSREACEKFRREASRDIPNYIAAGVSAFLPQTETAEERVEDVPFFYAITGVIRNTLLPLYFR